MYRPFLLVLLLALLVAVVGCGVGDWPEPSSDRTDPNGGPFGPVEESPLLAPFAGEWTLDFEKTLDARKDAGMSDEDIAMIRDMYADLPPSGRMHDDINITGNVAISDEELEGFVLTSEYRFFAMHQHDEKVCGKAWHHEDRFDYGDMSKYYVRLLVEDNFLYMEMKTQDGLPDLDDPDLFQDPLSTEGGSVESCDADNPKVTSEYGWSDWSRYVFSRKP